MSYPSEDIKLTRDGLIERLKELANCGDIEAAHSYADESLLQYINDKEITQLYDAIDKWYA